MINKSLSRTPSRIKFHSVGPESWDHIIDDPDPDFYLSSIFGYKCIHTRTEGGIYEVFQSAQRKQTEVKTHLLRSQHNSKLESTFTDFEESETEEGDEPVRLRFRK